MDHSQQCPPADCHLASARFKNHGDSLRRPVVKWWIPGKQEAPPPEHRSPQHLSPPCDPVPFHSYSTRQWLLVPPAPMQMWAARKESPPPAATWAETAEKTHSARWPGGYRPLFDPSWSVSRRPSWQMWWFSAQGDCWLPLQVLWSAGKKDRENIEEWTEETIGTATRMVESRYL